MNLIIRKQKYKHIKTNTFSTLSTKINAPCYSQSKYMLGGGRSLIKSDSSYQRKEETDNHYNITLG